MIFFHPDTFSTRSFNFFMQYLYMYALLLIVKHQYIKHWITWPRSQCQVVGSLKINRICPHGTITVCGKLHRNPSYGCCVHRNTIDCHKAMLLCCLKLTFFPCSKSNLYACCPSCHLELINGCSKHEWPGQLRTFERWSVHSVFAMHSCIQ